VGFQVSERLACRVIPVHRSSYRCRRVARDQPALRMRRREFAETRARYGYRRLHIVPQREGWRVNGKRVCRVYRLEGLLLRLQSRRKRPSHLRVAIPVAQAPHEHWSLDCISESRADGRSFRAFT
jgi:putative transposase